MDKNCQIIPRHYKSSECTIVSVSFSGYCIEETFRLKEEILNFLPSIDINCFSLTGICLCKENQEKGMEWVTLD